MRLILWPWRRPAGLGVACAAVRVRGHVATPPVLQVPALRQGPSSSSSAEPDFLRARLLCRVSLAP
eukprot:1929116-Pyramimonas_sp.AAC.1